MDFVQKIKKYIARHSLFETNSKILVAVSGGVDSIVLLHVLKKLELDIEAAHCNFCLRGTESDLDEKLVIETCKKLDVKLYTTSFDTIKISKNSKMSIEMTARELRYSWFEQLARANNCRHIAVAHHKNDNAETILMNIVRSTGIKGLAGIHPKRNNISRPLLCVSRDEIVLFARNSRLEWREDKSNQETVHIRNRIRHNIVAELQKINPQVVETLSNFSEQMMELNHFLEKRLKEMRKKVFDGQKIEISALQSSSLPKHLLFDILQEYNFSSSQLDSIYEAMTSSSGKQFLSKTHRLIKNRDEFILSPLADTDKTVYLIDKNVHCIIKPIRLNFEVSDIVEDNLKKHHSNVAVLDYDKIKFPIELCRWSFGDKFKPLGMRNFKKLSDFFTDQKLSIIQKQEVWLLKSDKEIFWVVNHRIDERFKVTKKTLKTLKIEIEF